MVGESRRMMINDRRRVWWCYSNHREPLLDWVFSQNGWSLRSGVPRKLAYGLQVDGHGW